MYIQRHRAPQRSLVCTRNLVCFEIPLGFRCVAGMECRSRQKLLHLLRDTCQHDITHTYTCCCFQREQGRQNTNNPGESRSLLQKSCLLGTRGAQTKRAGSSGRRGTARSFQRRAGSCRCQRGRQCSPMRCMMHWKAMCWRGMCWAKIRVGQNSLQSLSLKLQCKLVTMHHLNHHPKLEHVPSAELVIVQGKRDVFHCEPNLQFVQNP